MDAVSGDVMTTVPLDREQRDDYELVVQASDHGAPPLTSHVSVHVTVVDSNDNRPQFQKQSYVFYIKDPTHYGELFDELLHVRPRCDSTVSTLVSQSDTHAIFPE